MLPHRAVYDEEHGQFRETVRRFAASKIAPDFQRWEDAGIIDRSLWKAGGEAGLLCPQAPNKRENGCHEWCRGKRFALSP